MESDRALTWRNAFEALASGPASTAILQVKVHIFAVFALCLAVYSWISPEWSTELRVLHLIALGLQATASLRLKQDYVLSGVCMLLAGITYSYGQLSSGDRTPLIGVSFTLGAIFLLSSPTRSDWERIHARRVLSGTDTRKHDAFRTAFMVTLTLCILSLLASGYVKQKMELLDAQNSEMTEIANRRM